MGKKKEPEEAPGAPEWVVTFSDMISLLVTFFVMLLSFTTDSTLDEFPIPGLILGGRHSVVENEGTPSAVTPPENDFIAATNSRRGSETPHSRPEHALTEDLAEMGRKKQEQFQEVDFSKAIDGLVVRFDDDAGFPQGSAAISPKLHDQLADLADILKHYRHMIVVEGHTEADFTPSPGYPTPESLSAARALAAARLLTESGLPARVVQIASHGSNRPAGKDPGAADGRVEVRVLSLSRARAALFEEMLPSSPPPDDASAGSTSTDQE